MPLLLPGILFAEGRRTVTSRFRAAGITTDFRQGHVTVCSIGRHADDVAASTLLAVRPLLGEGRLRLAIGDTPTPRYGPPVEGSGIRHDPTPEHAGEEHLYGHLWGTLSALAKHPDWGTIALPLQAQSHVRKADLPGLPPPNARATSAPSWRWPSRNSAG